MPNIFQRLHARLRRLCGRYPRTAWICHPLFLQHNPGGRHPDRPERIKAIEEALIIEGIWPQLQMIEASEATDSQLALVHPRHYLRQLENLQPPPGKIRTLDDDTVISHESLPAARFAAGAVVQAVDMVMGKKAWHAFCAVRPPGHHAHSARAGGFCLINHAAVGAMHAIAYHRLQRVAIVDFDVHHGDGTAEIFRNDSRVLFLNAYESGLFPYPDPQCGSEANMVHTAFHAGGGSLAFRRRIRRDWLPRLEAFQPELVILGAGFDGHADDETGRLKLHEADYAWLTYRLIQAAASCKGRIVSVLEGGYTLDSLARSASAHIQVLAGFSQADYVARYNRRLRRLPVGSR